MIYSPAGGWNCIAVNISQVTVKGSKKLNAEKHQIYWEMKIYRHKNNTLNILGNYTAVILRIYC